MFNREIIVHNAMKLAWNVQEQGLMNVQLVKAHPLNQSGTSARGGATGRGGVLRAVDLPASPSEPCPRMPHVLRRSLCGVVLLSAASF